MHWYENWQPEAIAPGSLGVIKRGDVIASLIFEAFFLLWWNDVVVLQNWIPGFKENYHISLATVWSDYYWQLNILFGMFFLLHVSVSVRGTWRPGTLIAEIVGNAALLIIFIAISVSEHLIEVSGMMEESSLRACK